MTDIIAETEQMMRQERLEKFWKENGKTLILFAVLTVIATGLISAYRSWDANARTAGTEKALALMDDKSFPENIKGDKLEMRPGLRGIVLINGAQEYLAQDKKDEALKLYTRAATDKSIPGEIRDLAILMEARLSKDANANEELMKRLDGVANGKSPWRYHAAIESAALNAAKGDYPAARAHLADIMDAKDAPLSLSRNARALDHVYSLRIEEKSKDVQKQGS